MIDDILKRLQIEALNDMQQRTLQAARQGRDLMLLSPTGSGKTLAFLLSVLQRMRPQAHGVQALVIAPSRELALQIEKVWRSMGTPYKVSTCYGGHDTRIERRSLQEAPALIIGTPGRLCYHLEGNHFAPQYIHTLVLDEFDKALELGFSEQMAQIIQSLKGLGMRILTSATRAEQLPDFTGLRDPQVLDFLPEQALPQRLQLKAVRAEGTDKLESLLGLLCQIGDESSVVFCNHREAVRRISALLSERGLDHGAYQGEMEQEQRQETLIKFRNGTYRVLVATDLAARGLDIPHVRHVVHYQLPQTEAAYIHRSGRTARMQAEGTAYLVLAEEERIPPFVDEKPEFIALPEEPQLPPPTLWATLFVKGGKKDKINKVDLVGLFLKQGGLQKEELGMIEVLDHSAFVAVHRDKAQSVAKRLHKSKVKQKQLLIYPST